MLLLHIAAIKIGTGAHKGYTEEENVESHGHSHSEEMQHMEEDKECLGSKHFCKVKKGLEL